MADPTPEELAADAAAASSWTILFCQRDDDGRWRRDAQQYDDIGPDARLPLDSFWAAADPERVLLACLLNGLVATVDEEFTYADEPDAATSPWAGELELYERSSLRRRWFTVFAVWDTGDGPRRYSQFVEAVDATHAELQVRAAADRGRFLVVGVVDLRVPVADLPDWDIYATPDGQKPPAAASAQSSWRFWRR